MSSRPVCSTEGIPGQPEVTSETLSQKTIAKKTKTKKQAVMKSTTKSNTMMNFTVETESYFYDRL